MHGRIALAHLPTPLWHSDVLDRLLGAEVWVKRDDVTGAAESGNKLRKLEFLLADALAQGATHVITCGAVQSNHARATALMAARLGLRAVLLLRTSTPEAEHGITGNLLLSKIAGAEVRYISPADYAQRDERMASVEAEIAAAGGRAYSIPEGGSNGVGALGYVEAMSEVRRQLDLGLGGGPAPFDAVACACGSGGTAAGIAIGAPHHGVSERVLAFAVCDDRAFFDARIRDIAAEVGDLDHRLVGGEVEVIDDFKGPAYGIPSEEQLDFILRVARGTGLVMDPVYSGKALFGLAHMHSKPRRVLFLHTGGLPGLLAQHAVFATRLEQGSTRLEQGSSGTRGLVDSSP